MIMIIIAMMMSLLSGTKAIKNERLRKQRLKKNSSQILDTHQDDGIGVYQRTRKKRQKNCGSNMLM